MSQNSLRLESLKRSTSMLSRVKRYGMALIFLFLVIALMLLATLGVEDFGDHLLKDSNVKTTMKPKGERLAL